MISSLNLTINLIKMKKIDLVKLVEEVDKEEMIEGGVHKIFALTCLYKFIEMQEKAINYTHSCESDSEQLPSFLYKHEGGLYFRHLEDTDITEQWYEYLKTR